MQGIRNTGRANVGALEGLGHLFDLRSEFMITNWANLLIELNCGYLIVGLRVAHSLGAGD